MGEQRELEIQDTRLSEPPHRHRVAIPAIAIEAGLRPVLLVKDHTSIHIIKHMKTGGGGGVADGEGLRSEGC